MVVPYFLHTFNVPLFVPLPYFIRGRFVIFSTRRNKSLYTQGHLSFAGKNGLLYCRLFSSISLSVCLKHTVWNVIDILARSSISRSHCGRLSPSYNYVIVLFCFLLIYFTVFSRRGYCRLAAIIFAAWVAVPFFTSLRHF